MNSMNAGIEKVHVKNQTQEKYYQEILEHANIGIITMNHKRAYPIRKSNSKKITELRNPKPYKAIGKGQLKNYFPFLQP